MRTDLRATAQCFHLLSDPTRLAILQLLAKMPLHVAAIAKTLGIKQPLISLHLGVLRMGRLVEKERRARTVVYSIDKAAMKALASNLRGMMPR
jgi:ArsR family transcriptional regulator